MLSKYVNKITNAITIYVPGISEEKAEQIEYGLYTFFSDGLKLLAVSLVALILGKLKYTLVAVFVFAMYKSYLGGAHAKTQIGCIITYFILIFGSVYLSEIINIRYFNVIIFIVSAILVAKYAPADIVSKPIVTKKRKNELKIKGSILLTICLIITFIASNTYSNVISIITLISSINITPVVYEITKNKKGGIV